MAALLSGCNPDPCRALCVDAAQALDQCLPEWGVTWEELDAQDRPEWRRTCQTDWDATRAELEAREVPAAEDQCTDATEELADLSCDELRVLYLP